MTPDAALAVLWAQAEPGRAAEMARYHKTDRPVIGLSADVMNSLAQEWRRTLDLPTRLTLADGLWQSGVFEARITAAKLLTQARIRPEDDGAWDLLVSWVPDFDGWAIADAACGAIARRLVADPTRLDTVEQWTTSDHLWTKRAALVATLPWSKLRHPSREEVATRERVLAWAASYVSDRRWFIQKAVAWWLRDLSRKDPERVQAFLAEYGEGMASFARREAGRLMKG